MRERIKYLDVVRCVAAVMIVVHHFNGRIAANGITIGNNQHFTQWIGPNGNFGVIGVTLFFIISGASLMYVYDEKLELKKYLIKRWLSLFPLFYLSYFIVYANKVAQYKTIRISSAPYKNFILTIFGMDGYLSYKYSTWYLIGEWFLGCIIIMYLLFPLIRKLFLLNPYITMIVAALVYIVTLKYYCFDISIARNVLIKGLDFIFGMFFVYKIKKVKLVYGLLALAGLLSMSYIKIPGSDMYGITLTGFTLFIAIVWIVQNIKVEKLYKTLGVISKYTYGVFLMHHIVIECVVCIFRNRKLTYAQGIILFLVVCVSITIATFVLYSIYNSIRNLIKKNSCERDRAFENNAKE